MEGEIGRFRRNHLVPVPRVDSLAELNACIAAPTRRRRPAHRWRTETVGEAAAEEATTLDPLPAETYDISTVLHPDRRHQGPDLRAAVLLLGAGPPGRHRVRCAWGPGPVKVVDRGKVVAHHERSLHKGTEDLVLDHYLEILVRKPGALPGSTALAQARASGAFRPPTRRSGMQPGEARATGRHPGADRGAAAAPQPPGALRWWRA